MANICIGPSTTGTGSGADWNNIKAASSLSGTGWVRGNTYFARTGSYSGLSFNTTGTTQTFFTKATNATQNAVAGWVDSTMGQGQAVVTSATAAIDITTGNWTFNGVAGALDGSTTPYGFKFVSTGTADGCCGVAMRGGKSPGSTVQFCDISTTFPNGSLGTCAAFDERTSIFGTGVTIGLTVQNNYIHGGLVGMFLSGNGVTDQSATVQNNYMRNFGGQQHSECFGLANVFNVTIRWNNIGNLIDPSTTYIEPQQNGTSNPVPTGIYIYGNVFDGSTVGEGSENPSILSMTANEKCDTVIVANNTMYGLHGSSNGFPGLNDTGVSFVSGTTQSTNVTVVNNVWQNCVLAPQIGGTNVTSASNRLNTGTAASFISASTGNFRLTADTTGIAARTALSSPFNAIVDPDGTAYSTSLGAFQFVSSGPTPSSAAIGTNGTTMTVTWSGSTSNGAGGSTGATRTAGSTSGTATYASGTGSTGYTFTVPLTYQGAAVTWAYTQPGNGFEATTGGADVATFSGVAVTNNSTQAIPTPTGLAAGTPTASSIPLTWTDTSSGIAAFNVYQSLTNGSFVLVGTTAAGATSYSATGLASSTQYFFVIASTAQGVTGSQTSSVNATTTGSGSPTTSGTLGGIVLNGGCALL